MKQARLPRFKRSSTAPPLRLTDRDREIIRCLDEHRFLRSDHFTALLAGSAQQILRRLQRLYHHGYIDRPRCQIDYYQSGSRRMAYGLGNKGVALLKREPSLPFHRHNWIHHGRLETKLFLEHALMISDFMVALETACRGREDVRLIAPSEIQPPNATAGRREPFRWCVNVGGGHECGVIPDRVFGLKSGDKLSWFFLEADRGTMPVTRANLDRSSFYRKLLAYEATWSQAIHRSRFGWHRFRVLTIAKQAGRINTLVKACNSLSRGHGLFLFADAKSLQGQRDLFSAQWQTARAGTSRLLG